MSEPTASFDARRVAIARGTLRLYLVVTVLMIVGILALIAYSIRLGPLVGPGVESSFGLAVGLMFLMGALVVHLVDRAYRVWPLGRKVHPAPPGAVSDSAVATFVKILIFVAAAAAVAYVLGSLIAG